MERILYFDCFSGISGDMTLGALIDLGADPEVLKLELAKLNVGGYHLHVQETERQAITGMDVDVHLEDHDHEHDDDHHHPGHDHEEAHHHHDHGHNHGHEHGHGRSMKDIRELIEASSISPKAKKLSLDIFREIAVAEGKVHGKSPDEVHFHEVGAVDSIVDIVGTAICLDQLAVDRIYCSPIREGRGFIRCQHGMLPVPVPAVTEMLAGSRLSLVTGDTEGELVTPTGFGILKATAEHCGAMPSMQVEKVGYGFGKRDTGLLNALRIFMGTRSDEKQRFSAASDTVTVIETTIDDETGEVLGYALDRLFDAGALDAYYTPVYMKKNRPAIKLTVLCAEEKREDMARIIFSETSTIGLRYWQTERMTLTRTEETLSTPLGSVRIKRCDCTDVKQGSEIIAATFKQKPEYEDCVRLAKQHDLPLRQVYALIASLSCPKE